MAKQSLNERLGAWNSAEYNPTGAVIFSKGGCMVSGFAQDITATVNVTQGTQSTCHRCGFPASKVATVDITKGATNAYHLGCVPWRSIPGRPVEGAGGAAQGHRSGSPTKGQRQKLTKAIIGGQVSLEIRADTTTDHEETFAEHLQSVADRGPAFLLSEAQHASLLDVWQQVHNAGAIVNTGAK